MSTKLSRLKRKVASAQIATASIQMSTNFNLMVRPLLDKREFMDGWGEDVLTNKERQYLEQLLTRCHQDSQLLLKFSHRLRRL